MTAYGRTLLRLPYPTEITVNGLLIKGDLVELWDDGTERIFKFRMDNDQQMSITTGPGAQQIETVWMDGSNWARTLDILTGEW
jgi:hypothetical protein